MNWKRGMKLTMLCLMVFAVLLSVQPTEAATNVARVVNDAKMQMQKAYTTYVNAVAKTGKLPSKSAVMVEYSKANTLYTNAKKAVKKSGGKMKAKYLKELDYAYKVYITERVVPYMNAYNAWESSEKAKTALQEAIANEDIDALQSAYEKLGGYLTEKQAKLYSNVYGSHVRKVFLQQLNSNKTLYSQYANDVAVNKQLSQATGALEEGKLAEAKKALDIIRPLLNKLSNVFKTDLTKEYNDLLEVYNELIAPPVAELDFVEANNGKVTLYFDIPVASLRVDDIKITMTINGGTETEVTPLNVALSDDQTVATITVPSVTSAAEDQSIVYAVAYKGQKVSADAFTVAKQ